ncbi:Post-segregation antitoxin (ccd killing mechanism protein) encoded by the F plasmid [Serratia entomophila]|uniref:Type II toxin-antitoxin system CcdA family antitoxin n=1 Tax=Serratia entomophila TaxID=42906 RepID=A0ABY5CP05_9GAMM|nr:type II toxin-antitoxin system CcdA family antitoxin [Serratia entomophila]UIW17306.1 type II toxin-antitoxin system CcdA family antitoxin [Serratia entomophila]USU99862.1 type II toxin-antitoxin system CcdA family antitoxin [Serratia entomophila]CAI0824737.1 Post-segregation antitoxin (ccd killing mechanism protein) encoded by the F plasmid [Serratia entomophila]CAI0894925.1 Post-segregation antitoxin (ccd killing mechanism protein) encoded by the F plasmid [Serratia entomophila]CAI0898517
MRTNTADKSITKSVNVTLPQELLEQARRQNLDISAVLAEALTDKLRKTSREEWLEQNKTNIEALNAFTDEQGSFTDYQKGF